MPSSTKERRNYNDASKEEYDVDFVIAAGPAPPGRVFTRVPSRVFFYRW
jgi:hypothetical protein